MKFIATKNKNKKEAKHPDFRLYLKDGENVIEESYEKNDGTIGTTWKSFGAMWFKIENGKIKSAMIDIDTDAVDKQMQKETIPPAPMQTIEYPDDEINSNDFPF